MWKILKSWCQKVRFWPKRLRKIGRLIVKQCISPSLWINFILNYCWLDLLTFELMPWRCRDTRWQLLHYGFSPTSSVHCLPRFLVKCYTHVRTATLDHVNHLILGLLLRHSSLRHNAFISQLALYCFHWRVIYLWLCSKDLTKMSFDQAQTGSPEEILMNLKRGNTTYAVVYEILCR